MVFDNFQYPTGVDTLLFLQLCVYHCLDIKPAVTSEIRVEGQLYTVAISINSNVKVVYKNTRIYLT